MPSSVIIRLHGYHALSDNAKSSSRSPAENDVGVGLIHFDLEKFAKLLLKIESTCSKKFAILDVLNDTARCNLKN